MREERLGLRTYSILDKISIVIRQIERGEIKPGDIVYNSKALEDVIFVEKPPESLLLEYHETKRREGKISPFFRSSKIPDFEWSNL
jgi:hypothetical protein